MTGASATPVTGRAYAQGRALVLMAGVLFSAGGLIVRHIAVANDWQIVFYRSSGIVVGLFLFMAIRDRWAVFDTFRKTGLAGLCAAIAMTVSMTAFILAINATSVANAVFLLAAAPFMAAILGRLLLRESVNRTTWLAMAAALAGVTIMVWNGIAAGSLFGNAMGLLTALGFAAFTVALRFGRATDMLPSVCLAGAISAAIAAAVASGSGAGFVIPLGDFVLCAIYGATVAGGLSIYTLGSRSVPTAELTLLSLTEVLLGPLWVWLVLNETPRLATLVGGGVLLMAIAGQAAAGIARR
jgi:drug/metabolite transporter (DMT)-like permease